MLFTCGLDKETMYRLEALEDVGLEFVYAEEVDEDLEMCGEQPSDSDLRETEVWMLENSIGGELI